MKKIYFLMVWIVVFSLFSFHIIKRKQKYQNNIYHKHWKTKKNTSQYLSDLFPNITMHNKSNSNNNSNDKSNDKNNNSKKIKAFIINLKHRQDRLQSIIKTMENMQFEYVIIDAIDPRLSEYSHLTNGCFDTEICIGQVGCQYSHIKALNESMKFLMERENVDDSSYHIAIFEDDFILQPFVDPLYVKNAVMEAMNIIPDWEVIALSLNIISETIMHTKNKVNLSSTFQASLTHVQIAQTTTAFIVKKSIIPHILSSFVNCDVKKDYYTAIDQCWKHLQNSHKWIAFEPQLGTQSKSFSDIERVVVDYGIT